MNTSGLNRTLFALLTLLMLTACSKNAEIEGLLENYYRAAAKGDTESMGKLVDVRMFTLTTSSERGLLRSKVYKFVSEMNELSNANGEFKKIEITKVEEIKDKDELFLKVAFDLKFKNDRTIAKQEIISRVEGDARIYVVNEWARTAGDQMLYGY